VLNHFLAVICTVTPAMFLSWGVPTWFACGFRDAKLCLMDGTMSTGMERKHESLTNHMVLPVYNQQVWDSPYEAKCQAQVGEARW